MHSMGTCAVSSQNLGPHPIVWPAYRIALSFDHYSLYLTDLILGVTSSLNTCCGVLYEITVLEHFSSLLSCIIYEFHAMLITIYY